jgi:hypothetical protein
VARAELLRRVGFDPDSPAPVETLVGRVRAAGDRVYSADRFSFSAAAESRAVSGSVASGARSGS